MNETTKTLIDFTLVTTIATGSSILLTDSAGKGQRISPANLKAALNVANYDDVLDNVFVMCHRKSDNYPVAYRPSEWTAQQNAGEVATGVLIIDGGLGLVKVSLLRFLKIHILKNTTTPIHDHVRKKLGWSNAQVVFRFAIIQIGVSLATVYLAMI